MKVSFIMFGIFSRIKLAKAFMRRCHRKSNFKKIKKNILLDRSKLNYHFKTDIMALKKKVFDYNKKKEIEKEKTDIFAKKYI